MIDLIPQAQYRFRDGQLIQLISSSPNPLGRCTFFYPDSESKAIHCLDKHRLLEKIDILVSMPLLLPFLEDAIATYEDDHQKVAIAQPDYIDQLIAEIDNLESLLTVKSSRGGKRSGAGRKASGNPPKKRKALQLDYDLASKLPDLRSFADLLDQYRPIAESGTLRATKLAEFFQALDKLPFI